jgi:parvulin-like peptidyl-prolyl isomerase
MIKKLLLIILIIIYFDINSKVSAQKISTSIIAKVGNEIITSYDLEDEIKFILIMSNKEINQKNINETKQIAVSSLVRTAIKNSEIKKYKISKYSKIDLDSAIRNAISKLNINKKDFKILLESNNISFEKVQEKYKTELLWNTLIYKLYNRQININTVEVESELKKGLEIKREKKSYELSELEFQTNDNIDSRIKEILSFIEKEGFARAVEKYSISLSRENMGLIGWFDENALSTLYINALKNIKINETTKPIKQQASFVILKVNNIKIIKKDQINQENVKKQIINKKKEEKLNLFSKTHFSNLENSILITFK